MANKETVKLYNGEVELVFYPDSHRYKLEGEKGWLISVTSITSLIDKSRILIKWAIGLSGAYVRKFIETTEANSYSKEEVLALVEEALKQHDIKRDEAASIGEETHRFAQIISEALRDNKPINEIEELNNFNKLIEDANSDNTTMSDEDKDRVNKIANGISAFVNWLSEHKIEFVDAEKLLYSKKHKYAGITDAIVKYKGKLYLIDYKTSKGIYSEMEYQVGGYCIAYEEETGKKLDGQAIVKFDKETGEFEFKEICKEDNDKNKKTFLHLLEVKKREKELAKY